MAVPRLVLAVVLAHLLGSAPALVAERISQAEPTASKDIRVRRSVLESLASGPTSPDAISHGAAAVHAPSIGGGSGLPPTPGAATSPDSAWLGKAQQDLRRREYEFSANAEGGYSAPNRAHDPRAKLDGWGMEVVSRTHGASTNDGGWSLKLLLSRFGREDSLTPVDPASPVLRDGRVMLERGALTEWYANDERGIEQGFDIPAPPGAGTSALPLVIDLDLSGSLGAYPSEDGRTVHFRDTGGDRLTYSGLKVTDSRGTEVPSQMSIRLGGVRLVIHDEGASYPLRVDPTLTGSVWAAEGDQAGAFFGLSVTTAGDVNGDGYSDVIVGAYGFDHTFANEGRAFVYHGSASGLSFTASWTADGGQAGASFGASAATAGDVNGDGYSDVIVGAQGFDDPEPDEGAAFVYLGSPSGLSPTASWTAESNQAGALFGGGVGTAGDVNGDGYSDVIVAAILFDNGQIDEGRAFVYLGSASGPSATPSWTAEGDQPAAQFGGSVGTAGDVNADGYSDVIIGAPYFDNGQTDEGQAYLYRGSASGLPSIPSWTRDGSQTGALFGQSVGAAGDVNGDGYSDVIIGAYGYDSTFTDEGRALVYNGTPAGGGLLLSPSWTMLGGQAGEQFGVRVSTAGDVNGDGYSDVIVGAWGFDNGQTDEGAAFDYLGSAAGLSTTASWTAESNQTGALFGLSVGTAGDVDGDGYSEVIVGAFQFDVLQADAGVAWVLRGSPTGLGREGIASTTAEAAWTVVNDQDDGYFGYSVATAGDVNGDGYSDVIAGAPLYDNGQVDEGRAFLYLGSASGLSTTPAWTAESDQAGAEFGTSVASAMDVNGDGYSDVIVGAPYYDNAEVDEGRAFLYLGSASGLAPTPAWSAESDQAGASFGISVATAGDVNSDGYGDVIVGAPDYDNVEVDEGRVFVYQGSASGLSPAAAWTAESDRASAFFGFSVATAGDVNGDGYSDVFVGDHRFDYGHVDDGACFVWYGSAPGLGSSGTPSNADWMAEGNQAGAEFGYAVATAGDVNGDGYSDLIVGALNYDDPESNEGAAFVWLGSAAGPVATGTPATGTPANADWIAESDQIDAQFGASVATAGDVNGDGYSDVLVGAPLYDVSEMQVGAAFAWFGGAGYGGGLGSNGTPANARWVVVDDATVALGLGISVASVGDINGDGFSDVILGEPSLSGPDPGRTFLYYGNAGDGLDQIPRQARADDSALLDLLGESESQTSFRLKLRGRSPVGRARVRLQWEVKPLGTPFNAGALGQGTVASTGAPVAGTGSAVELDELVTGLSPGTSYHWRVRSASDSPFFPHSHWYSLPYNSPTEKDLRTFTTCQDADGDGYGTPGDPVCPAGGATDCDDLNAAIHPGAIEVCNGADDDCDSVSDNAPVPTGVPLLTVILSFSGVLTQLSWSSVPNATRYDTVRGDLIMLHANGGLFTPTVQACLVDDSGSASLIITDPPLLSRAGFWYLTRAESCGGSGSYDSGGPGQVGSQDAEISASGSACP